MHTSGLLPLSVGRLPRCRVPQSTANIRRVAQQRPPEGGQCRRLGAIQGRVRRRSLTVPTSRQAYHRPTPSQRRKYVSGLAPSPPVRHHRPAIHAGLAESHELLPTLKAIHRSNATSGKTRSPGSGSDLTVNSDRPHKGIPTHSEHKHHAINRVALSRRPVCPGRGLRR